MAQARDDIPRGTLDMLILKTVASHAPLHGFDIARCIQMETDDVLQVEEGSLYPALQRLLVKGWIQGRWGATEENRRARFYRLTPDGRKQLEHEVATYQRVTAAISQVLRLA